MKDHLENILILNDTTYVNGGAAKVASLEAKGLAARGLNVIFFSGAGTVDDFGERPDGLCIETLQQIEILDDPNVLRAATKGLWNNSALRTLSAQLDQLPREKTLVHIHSWTKVLSSSVIREVVQRGFPVVCTLHDYFTACPNGGFFDYQDRLVCDLKPLSPSCIVKHCDSRAYSHKLWRVARHFIQKRFAGMPTKVRNFILVSEFSHTILAPYLDVSSQAYRLSNPVDITKDTPVDVQAKGAFYFVGRVAQEKGARLFARAVEACGVKGVMVGDGPELLNLKEMYPSLEYTGWLDNNAVMEQLRSARALVFPSLCYETQGLTVLEAAAMGVPTIVSDACAAQDFISPDQNGVLFTSGCADALARQMSRLVLNPGFARRLGSEAYRAFWANPATLDNHIDELMKIYDDIHIRSTKVLR